MNQYPKKLLQSRYLRKVFKLSIIGIIIVLVFTGIFYLFDHTHFNGFGKEQDKESKILNRLYFTMTTFSFMAKSPNSAEIKIISMILQFILVIAMLGGILEFE